MEVEMRARSGGGGQRGMSMIELAVVVAIMCLVMVIAIPQIVGARRNMRASAGPAEVKAQLRYARQQALGLARAVTFQYDTLTREINVIQHNRVYPVAGGGTTMAGTPVLNDGGYPLTPGYTLLRTIPLAAGGIEPDEIAYGLPPGAPTTPLADTTRLTAPVNNQINITFQPDGSVIDATGATANFAMMFYHPDYAEATARAVSVLGATGRVKVWRYTDVQTWVE